MVVVIILKIKALYDVEVQPLCTINTDCVVQNVRTWAFFGTLAIPFNRSNVRKELCNVKPDSRTGLK